MSQPYKTLIAKLIKLYGPFDDEHKKFKSAPNSEITRELGYSDAQFSRLINGHATEGEYARAIQNADRIMSIQKLETQFANLSKSYPRRKVLAIVIPLLIICIAGAFLLGQAYQTHEKPLKDNSRFDMLRWSFDTKYVNPYIKLVDLPVDCNFPCYKYQGKWELKEPYKLPFFREKSGFHYAASEVHMYARCLSEKNDKGDYLEGYEYQKHEIWYDKREQPLDSFLIDNDLRPEYRELELDKDINFVKVAYVHTFFRNEFALGGSEIVRSGKVIGRDIEFIDREDLSNQLGSKELTDDVLEQVNRIITNRLEDFSRPISCGPSALPNANFNDITQNNEMGFSCQLTTGRFAVNYNKSYMLTSQFIKNKCRPE